MILFFLPCLIFHTGSPTCARLFLSCKNNKKYSCGRFTRTWNIRKLRTKTFLFLLFHFISRYFVYIYFCFRSFWRRCAILLELIEVLVVIVSVVMSLRFFLSINFKNLSYRVSWVFLKKNWKLKFLVMIVFRKGCDR